MDVHKPKPWHGFRKFLKNYLSSSRLPAEWRCFPASRLNSEGGWRVRIAEGTCPRACIRSGDADSPLMIGEQNLKSRDQARRRARLDLDDET